MYHPATPGSIIDLFREWQATRARCERNFHEDVTVYVQKRLLSATANEVWGCDIVSRANDLLHYTGICFVEMTWEVERDYQRFNEEDGSTVDGLLKKPEACQAWSLRMMAALTTKMSRVDYLFPLIWEVHALRMRMLIRWVLEVPWKATNASEVSVAVELRNEIASAASQVSELQSWLCDLNCDTELVTWVQATWSERSKLEPLVPHSLCDDSLNTFGERTKTAAQTNVEELIASLAEDSCYSPLVRKSVIRNLKGLVPSQFKRMVADGRIRTKDGNGQFVRAHYDDVEGLREKMRPRK